MSKSQAEVVLFDRDRISKVLSDFDFRVVSRKLEGKQKQVVVSPKGDDVHCPSCKRQITESHVGTIAKGSRLIFCDNPVCFSTWVGQHKL